MHYVQQRDSQGDSANQKRFHFLNFASLEFAGKVQFQSGRPMTSHSQIENTSSVASSDVIRAWKGLTKRARAGFPLGAVG